ncbi:MAG: hypothetical protein V3T31_08185, partial [candidate division Zixibacteria bacterium]
QVINRGFEGDLSFVPSALVDLVVKPDSVSAYDRLTRLGWNGPYVDGDANKYADDAWGNAYLFEPASRRLVSVGAGGPGDSIIITF